MNKFLCVIPLVLLVFVSLGVAAETSNFTFNVTFGPHPVGFRVVHQYDYSRVYKPAFDLEGKPVTGERARPIQTLIWYPAQPDSSAQTILYGRYFELLATEENFDDESKRNAAAKAAAFMVDIWEVKRDKFEAEWMRPTRAYWEAKAAPGKFPVVIFAPGFSAPAFQNSDLCEYLTSHGYVVVASPDMGAHTRTMTGDVAGIQTQAADIEFLIGYLHTLPQADLSQIAVSGFSWGGISNIFAAMQDERIKALVCLDGSIRYGNKFLNEVNYVTPNRLTVPLLYLSQRSFTIEELSEFKIDVSTSFLNECKYSDFHFVLFNGMKHSDFSSDDIRFRSDNDFTDYTAAEISESYSWMARYVLQFLNAYLKSDGTAREFLKNSPEKNGAPRHQLAMKFRPALRRPAPFIDDFVRELSMRGFDKAIPIWQEALALNPAFILPESDVNSFGYHLLSYKKLDKAISVFKLNVAMYPESYNAYDSLAEAQVAAGDKKNAIANYKKSLELNHGNTNAVEQLKMLEANQVK
jgi:dienelactone hydrolase